MVFHTKSMSPTSTTKTMAKTAPSTVKLGEVVTKIVDLLSPLDSDQRQRAVSASLTILGEAAVRGPKGQIEDDENKGAGEAGDLPTKAKTWLRQNGLTLDQLSDVFHITDGTADVIASEMPGKNKKAQSLNAYVLAGLAQLLANGEPTFTDKNARNLCSSSGCYDNANHSATLKDKGNWFTGSKDKGWTLTALGLKHGAQLVKELTGAGK